MLQINFLWKVEISQQRELFGKPIQHLPTEVWNSLEFNGILRPCRGKRSGFAKEPINAITFINLNLNKTIFPTGNSGVWHLLNVQLNTSGQVKSSASLPYILYCWLGFTFPQVSLPRPKGKWWNTLHMAAM